MRTHNNFHILIMTKTKLIVSHRGQAHLHPTTPLPPTRWQSSWRARRSSPCLPRSQSSVGSGLTSHLDKGCLAPVCISRKWSLSSCLEPPLLLEMVPVKIISDQFQGEKLIWGQRRPFNHQDLSNWTVKIWSDGALPRLWKGRGNKQSGNLKKTTLSLKINQITKSTKCNILNVGPVPVQYLLLPWFVSKCIIYNIQVQIHYSGFTQTE